MLRRKAKRGEASTVGIAYEDRSRGVKTKRRPATHCNDDVDDKELEELVFGKQLFAESTNLFQSESDAVS